MSRCYPSAVVGVCCSRPGPRSRLQRLERWTAASGSHNPSSFSSYRPEGWHPSHPTGQPRFVGLSAMHGPRRLWRICRPERRVWGQFPRNAWGQFPRDAHLSALAHFLITYSLAEGRDDGSIGNARYSTSHLGEAGDERPESLPRLLPYRMEVGLHAVLLVSTGEVHNEPRAELFPGAD
jgi:hypothetical protein